MSVKHKPFKIPSVSPPMVFSALLLPMLTGRRWLLLFALAALLHELGHLAALRLLGGRVEGLCFRLSGAEIRYRGGLSYGGEVLLALAGPVANLLCAALCAWLALWRPGEGLYQFIGCHVTLALFNLLPALPLDGGRVLKALLEARFPLWGETAAQISGLLIGCFLLFQGLISLGVRANPTLAAAGWVILLRSGAKNALHLPKNLLK